MKIAFTRRNSSNSTAKGAKYEAVVMLASDLEEGQ
jgi:hypothetical protein